MVSEVRPIADTMVHLKRDLAAYWLDCGAAKVHDHRGMGMFDWTVVGCTDGWMLTVALENGETTASPDCWSSSSLLERDAGDHRCASAAFPGGMTPPSSSIQWRASRSRFSSVAMEAFANSLTRTKQHKSSSTDSLCSYMLRMWKASGAVAATVSCMLANHVQLGCVPMPRGYVAQHTQETCKIHQA